MNWKNYHFLKEILSFFKNYENQNFENENDEINDYNFNEDDALYNEYDNEQDNYNDNENENGEEDQYLNENDIYALSEENIRLKNKCQLLFNILNQKNNEKKQFLIQYNKTKQDMSKYIMLIQNLKNELNEIKQKYFNALKEIKMKNKILADVQNGVNINDINLENYNPENLEKDENFILSINDKILNIRKDILEEINSKNIGKDDLQMLEKNKQIENLIVNLDKLGKDLHAYKNKNMETIINLRNSLDSINNNINIKDQFYLNIIDIIKNTRISLDKNLINIEKFPSFSLNDENDVKIKNILTTIQILSDYIISSTNNQKSNNYMNEELSKRIKEMSELLVKSNENLSKSRKDNIELKQKLGQLEIKYNSIINKNEDNNTNNKNNIDFISKEKDYENLKEELNKKNQQIKSLEHMITRLSNKKENNSENNNDIENNSLRGKIINKKNSNNLYFKENKFVKDGKIEKNLQIFLDKFTNGEYSGSFKIKNNINNINSLKEEVDKLNERINKELEKKF